MCVVLVHCPTTAVEIDTGRVPELPASLLQISSAKSKQAKSREKDGKSAREKDGKKSQVKTSRNTSSNSKASAEGHKGQGSRRNESGGRGGSGSAQHRAGPSTGLQPNPYQLDAVENFAVQADFKSGAAPLSLSDRCEHSNSYFFSAEALSNMRFFGGFFHFHDSLFSCMFCARSDNLRSIFSCCKQVPPAAAAERSSITARR